MTRHDALTADQRNTQRDKRAARITRKAQDRRTR